MLHYKTLLPLILCWIALLINGYAQPSNVDATYLLLKKEYRFHRHGGYELTYEHRLKYQSYFAFHRLYGETFVVYNPEFQKLFIDLCETTMAYGEKITAPDNAFNEVLPSWAANAPQYNHWREMVITHTGLEIGAVVHLKYRIVSQPDKKGFWHFNEPLVMEVPVEQMQISFVFPKGVEFQFYDRTPQMKPLIEETVDSIKYSFNVSNVPMKDLTGLVDKHFYPMVVLQVGQKDLPQFLTDLGEKSEPLNSITSQQADSALSIRNRVGLVNTIHVPSAFQKFPIQSPKVTLARNSGTPLEKAILLADQLRSAGISCKLALKIPSSYFQFEATNLSLIEDVFVIIKPENQFWVLTTEKEQVLNKLDFPGYVIVYLDESQLGVFYDSRPKNVQSQVTLSLIKDGEKVNISGTENTRYNYQDPILLVKSTEKLTSKRISNWAGEVENVAIGMDCGLCYSLKIAESEVPMQGKIAAVSIPTLKYGVDFGRWKALPETISGPLRIGGTQSEQTSVEIILPPKARLVGKPKSEKRSGPFGEVEIDIQQKGNSIFITRKVSFKPSLVLPSQYSDFREAMRVVYSHVINPIYIEIP